MIEKETSFIAGESSGTVSAIFMRPEKARWLMVLAHGAAAGMRHGFMTDMAQCLARHGIASFRYQFPYMEEGKKAPSAQPILLKTVRSAVAAAREHGRDLPLLAGGKSLGGRMTSTAASQGALPGVKGIFFFGFPLHAPGKPSSERGEHLFEVRLPMLFLQGTRDNLADLSYLQPLIDRLQTQEPASPFTPARLHIIDGADHSFNVPKKMEKTGEDVFEEMGKAVEEWASEL